MSENISIRDNDILVIDYDDYGNCTLVVRKGAIAHRNSVERLPKKYIINKDATVLFWEDGTKTVVKRAKDDEYNKILGFLWAYFQKTSGLSKSKANEYLRNLVDAEELEAIKIIQSGQLSKTLSNLAEGLSKAFGSIGESIKNSTKK